MKKNGYIFVVLLKRVNFYWSLGKTFPTLLLDTRVRQPYQHEWNAGIIAGNCNQSEFAYLVFVRGYL